MLFKKLNIAASAALAVVFAVVLTVVFAIVLTASEQAPLVEGFKNPPDKARPRVYWYWMNGNITKEGITKDIEWFYRAGIRGMETFDVGGFAGRGGTGVVNPPLLYMQPDWKDAFHHALQEADKRGMEITIGAAPGWSQAGAALGETGRRDEEVRLDRDGGGGRQAISGHTAEAAGGERAVSGSSTRWTGWSDPADVL
jgi:alpha-L-rhamnosidase